MNKSVTLCVLLAAMLVGVIAYAAGDVVSKGDKISLAVAPGESFAVVDFDSTDFADAGKRGMSSTGGQFGNDGWLASIFGPKYYQQPWEQIDRCNEPHKYLVYRTRAIKGRWNLALADSSGTVLEVLPGDGGGVIALDKYKTPDGKIYIIEVGRSFVRCALYTTVVKTSQNPPDNYIAPEIPYPPVVK